MGPSTAALGQRQHPRLGGGWIRGGYYPLWWWWWGETAHRVEPRRLRGETDTEARDRDETPSRVGNSMSLSVVEAAGVS